MAIVPAVSSKSRHQFHAFPVTCRRLEIADSEPSSHGHLAHFHRLEASVRIPSWLLSHATAKSAQSSNFNIIRALVAADNGSVTMYA